MPRENRGMVSTAGKAGYFISATIFLLIGGTLFSCMFGGVAGTEFNPYSFETRDFSYFEIPLVGAQVMPIARIPSSNDLQQWINVDENVLMSPGQQRWDLVEGVRAAQSSQQGEAAALHEYLGSSNDEGELVWLGWSERHPQRARKLWPQAAWLAQQELYHLVPELMSVAAGGHASLESFQEATESYLERELTQTAEHVRQAGDSSRGDEIEQLAAKKAWRALERPPGPKQSQKAKQAKQAKKSKPSGPATSTGGDEEELPAEAPDPSTTGK